MPEQLRQGPATFTLDDAPVVPAAGRPALSSPTAQPAQIAPGLTAGAPAPDNTDARTFKAIADLASGMLSPKIEQAAKEQFVQGVQQAMTGEALGEIVRDKPWYTDIFAPSAALAGARAYTTQTAIAKWAGRMQELMPQLAQRGPEDLQAAAVGAMQGFMTGDAQADALITAGVTEQMAPLFKQHAKEHYVHVQKQATEAQIGAWEALGKVYQGYASSEARGDGMVTPGEREAAAQRMLGAIAPFADQSDEAFERNVAAFLEGSASQGNFAVVRLFKDSGLYDKINPDKRAALDRSIKVFARDALNNAMPQFAMDVATLVNDMTQDPSKIVERVKALNDKAARATGVTEQELIPPQYLDNLIGRVMVSQQHEADARRRAAMTAAEKDAEKAGKVGLALSLLTVGPGRVDSALALGLGVDEHSVEQAGGIAYGQAKTPEDRAKVLNARVLKPFEGIKAAFATTLAMPEYGAGTGDLAKVYAGLTENVKALYFDEHERALLDRFNRQVLTNTPPDQAWVAAKTAPTLQQHMLPANAKDEASKAIRAAVESANENLFGFNTVDDAGLRILEAATAKAYKADRANNPPDVAAKRAYAQALSNGVAILGKHVVIQSNPQDRPLFALIGEGQRATGTAFEELMAEKAGGRSLDYYEAVRVPDRNGKAYYYVHATAGDGTNMSWNISSDEVKARVADTVKRKLTHPVGTPPAPPVIGPQGAAFGLYPR